MVVMLLTQAAPATVSKPIGGRCPTALGELPTEFAEAMARLIDNTLPALGDDDPASSTWRSSSSPFCASPPRW